MLPMPSPSSVSASDTVMASSSPASKNVNVPKAQEHQTQPVLNAATPGCGSVKGKTVSDFGVKVASASETDIADSRKKKAQCRVCNKILSSSRHLKRHTKEVHSTGPDKTCNDCGQKFKSERYLRSHIAAMHDSNKKTHKCDQCGMTFSYPSLLKNHLITHTDKRNFVCTDCFATYKTKTALTAHNWKKHSQREHPFKCLKCETAFLYSFELKRHQTTHLIDKPKPYQCQLCNQKFVYKSSLKKHNRKNCINKCAQCNTLFVSRYTFQLDCHKCRNANDRTCKCPVCPDYGRCFASKQKMKLHAERKHADLQVKEKPAKSDGHKEAIRKILLKKQNVASDSVINQSHSVTDQPSTSGTCV